MPNKGVSWVMSEVKNWLLIQKDRCGGLKREEDEKQDRGTCRANGREWEGRRGFLCGAIMYWGGMCVLKVGVGGNRSWMMSRIIEINGWGDVIWHVLRERWQYDGSMEQMRNECNLLRNGINSWRAPPWAEKNTHSHHSHHVTTKKLRHKSMKRAIRGGDGLEKCEKKAKKKRKREDRKERNDIITLKTCRQKVIAWCWWQRNCSRLENS